MSLVICTTGVGVEESDAQNISEDEKVRRDRIQHASFMLLGLSIMTGLSPALGVTSNLDLRPPAEVLDQHTMLQAQESRWAA